MNGMMEQVAAYGLPLVFVNVLAEQLGLPVPALPTLVVAGALVADGRLPWLPLVVVSLVASLLADSLWYVVGRRHGYRVLATVCRLSLSPDSCVHRTESAFERFGMPSLVFAKFIPGFSTVAPPLAGATRAPVGEFLFFNGAGTLLWVGVGLGVGIAFHDAIDDALRLLGRLGGWALVVLAAGLLVFVALKWWQRYSLERFLKISRITVHELKRLFDGDDKPLVIDVRSRSVRRRDSRRIPGALVMDLEELAATIATLPRDREIALYCT